VSRFLYASEKTKYSGIIVVNDHTCGLLVPTKNKGNGRSNIVELTIIFTAEPRGRIRKETNKAKSKRIELEILIFAIDCLTSEVIKRLLNL
jgi:hypothetical protein